MIRVKNLYLRLKKFRLVDVNLNANKGDYLVILGPSGAGKTLLLECIAGLRKPNRGRIIINGVDVTYLPPERRGLAFAPQNYALWPHMNVFDNIAYPLKLRGYSKGDIKFMVQKIAEELNLKDLLDKSPKKLSGGESQRVALARALIWNPKGILLDEPTAALDPSLKRSAWNLLKRLYKKMGFTAIHVTHDVAEATALATRAAFMYHGRIIKEGSLDDVLSTDEALKYLGDVNFLKGKVLGKGSYGETFVSVNSVKLVVAGEPETQDIALSLRPEDVIVLKEASPHISARNVLNGTIVDLEPRGPLILLKVRVRDLVDIKAYVTKASLENMGLSRGSNVYIAFKASALKIIA